MTKTELRAKLLSGAKLEDLFPWRPGQDCDIFKDYPFTVDDEIIYIPDVYLNCLFSTPDVDEILANCYTGQDFVDECDGDIVLAERLFEECDWQHPSSLLAEIEDVWQICRSLGCGSYSACERPGRHESDGDRG